MSRGDLTPLWMEKVGGILEQEDWKRLLFLPTKN
jgi:hypothetical protein